MDKEMKRRHTEREVGDKEEMGRRGKMKLGGGGESIKRR